VGSARAIDVQFHDGTIAGGAGRDRGADRKTGEARSTRLRGWPTTKNRGFASARDRCDAVIDASARLNESCTRAERRRENIALAIIAHISVQPKTDSTVVAVSCGVR
jgi:hypothetical protein